MPYVHSLAVNCSFYLLVTAGLEINQTRDVMNSKKNMVKDISKNWH